MKHPKEVIEDMGGTERATHHGSEWGPRGRILMTDSYYITENQLQTTVAMYLDQCLPAGAYWWHTPNEGKRGFKAQGDFKRHGGKAGIPDCSILYGGEYIGIELKRPASPGRRAGTLSPDQREAHQAIQKAGCAIYTCHSLSEVIDALSGHMRLKGQARRADAANDPGYAEKIEQIREAGWSRDRSSSDRR